jgi:hypothetical protein
MLRAVVAFTAVAVTVAACGQGSPPKTPGAATGVGGPATGIAETKRVVMPIPSGPRPAVSPLRGGRHVGFRVFVINQHHTGVFGKTRRSYHVEAHAVRPAVACVNTTYQRFPDGELGETMYATLSPDGEGGPVGWCRGLFKGTVRYEEAFACPPIVKCETPRGFPARSEVVVRFTFRVL